MDVWWIVVRFHGRARNVSFFRNIQTSCGFHRACYTTSTGRCWSVSKRPRRESTWSFWSSVEVMNWLVTPCLRAVHGGNSAFTFIHLFSSLSGIDGPGIESRWERNFPHLCRLALGPTQPPIQCRPALFPRLKAAGAWRWLPPPSSAEVKERVELYLYFQSRPSWPVLGWTLPLPFYLQFITLFFLRFI